MHICRTLAIGAGELQIVSSCPTCSSRMYGKLQPPVVDMLGRLGRTLPPDTEFLRDWSGRPRSLSTLRQCGRIYAAPLVPPSSSAT